MNQKRSCRIGIFLPLLFFVLLFSLHDVVHAQKKVNVLTRGRAWSSAYEAFKMTVGPGAIEGVTYPGFYSSQYPHPNGMWGMRWYQGPGYVQRFNGDLVMAELNEQKYHKHMDILQPSVLVQNYNFKLSPTQPEEYMWGVVQHKPDFLGKPHPKVRIRSKQMVWSLPKYDDFIIQRHVIINEEPTQTIEDFYWFWTHTIIPTYGGRQHGYVNDDEYIWASDIRTYTDEQGAFVFYDDTEIMQNSPNAPTIYEISPGDVTGDRGDPGNIQDINSIDRRLYSPQIVSDWIVDCSVNKNGEKKVWFNITSRGNGWWGNHNGPGSPTEEKRFWGEDPNKVLNYITNDQPRMDWAEAFAADPLKIYERTPAPFLSAGPYDIAPGDSIEIIRLMCFGEMDRNVSMLGGPEATQSYKELGMKNFRENWNAALELIDGWRATGNWNAGITAYPPPTPGNVPGYGYEDELIVKLYIDPEKQESGFDISWVPVPDDYVDPIKQYNDFVGYKVYRSEMSVMGPWKEVADIKKEEAKSLIDENGRITYRLPSKTGIPYRFCITTYDDEGLESGKTAYSLYGLAAKSAPSDNFSRVRVIPNPFKQTSRLTDLAEAKRLTFMFIPSVSTIKIFNVAGELIQTIEHDDGFGEEAWGSTTGNDYMLTRFAQNVIPGVYIYYVESHVPGHEGESATGKFVIIK